MRVLVVGGGGREHAIVEALRRSRADIYAAMANQNPGIRRASKEVLLGDVTAVDPIVRWASDRQIELAIIGPEGPLEKGITDALEAAHIPTVGPSREAAQLETNKEFTRELVRDHGIPGAPRFWAFGDLPEFENFVNASDFEFVIKPLGLTAGKGVRVWGDHFTTKAEALAYGKEILTKQIGGVPRFLVEEKLVGEEFSLQALCDGHALVRSPRVPEGSCRSARTASASPVRSGTTRASTRREATCTRRPPGPLRASGSQRTWRRRSRSRRRPSPSSRGASTPAGTSASRT